MAKIEEQLAQIDQLLQQILKNTGESESENGNGESEGCPYCGCNGEHEGGHGKMVIMVGKKKPNGEMPEMPSILKDVLKAMTKS